jgi:hypothetical protein
VLPQIPEPARPACAHTSQKHKSVSVRNGWYSKNCKNSTSRNSGK